MDPEVIKNAFDVLDAIRDNVCAQIHTFDASLNQLCEKQTIETKGNIVFCF